MAQIHDTPAPLPDDVPAPVRRLVDTAMSKDPAARFRDGAAFRDAIDDLRGGGRTQPAGVARTAVLPAVTAPIRGDALDPTVSVRAARGATPPPTTRAAREPEPRLRRKLLVPLLALLAVVAIVLGAVALTRDPDGTPANTTAPTAPMTSAPAPSSAAATPTRATASAAPSSTQPPALNAREFVGRPVEEAVTKLTGLGFNVVREERENPAETAGTVVDVRPTGRLTPGTTITVTYATAPATPTPTPTPTPAPPAPTAAPSPSEEDEPDENEPDEKENGNGNGRDRERGRPNG